MLSGYLITARLLQEDRIDLRRFYLRRFFRLMPCAWLYLLSVALLGLAIRMPIIGSDAWASVFFYRNYWPTTDNSTNVFTAHFWSLSLEEQFYLAWPPVLLLAGRKWSLRIAVAGAAACAIFRYLNWAYSIGPSRTFTPRCASMPCSSGAPSPSCCATSRSVRGSSAMAPGSSYACIPAYGWYIYRYQQLIPFAESLLIALMIAITSTRPSFAISRALENRQLRLPRRHFLQPLRLAAVVSDAAFRGPVRAAAAARRTGQLEPR